MKNIKHIKHLAILTTLIALPMTVAAASQNDFIEIKAASGPTYVSSLNTNIDLNRNSVSEIRDYYASLNSLSNSERSGTNLLKNLRPILQDMSYYNYDAVWKIYEITDREWELSPASETKYGTYNANANTISGYEYGSSKNAKNDPYVKTLYRNKDENGVTLEAARIKEWGSHNNDGTNREHIWCQSRGFKASSGAKGPAGTDLHHLRSGDGYINQSLHNDNPYGYVDKNQISKDGKTQASYLSGNLLGKPLNASSQDQGTVVFEPQDSDKGDIARAVFYMAACYNNLDGNAPISEFLPNLEIVDYVYDAKSAITSSTTQTATMAKLSDLLEWHKLDPVDDFEIYRNDLIYNNYQHNRNPFIDFPDWVDVVWGNTGKVATPTKDLIHGYGSAVSIPKSRISVDISKNKTFTLSATSIDASPITWTISDTSIVACDNLTSASGEDITFNVLKTGEVTITASATIDGETHSSSTKVIIEEGFVIEPWMIIAAVVVIVIIIVILIVSSSARKAVKKAAKKAVKKATKKATKTAASSKKKTTKKKK